MGIVWASLCYELCFGVNNHQADEEEEFTTEFSLRILQLQTKHILEALTNCKPHVNITKTNTQQRGAHRVHVRHLNVLKPPRFAIRVSSASYIKRTITSFTKPTLAIMSYIDFPDMCRCTILGSTGVDLAPCDTQTQTCDHARPCFSIASGSSTH